MENLFIWKECWNTTSAVFFSKVILKRICIYCLRYMVFRIRAYQTIKMGKLDLEVSRDTQRNMFCFQFWAVPRSLVKLEKKEMKSFSRLGTVFKPYFRQWWLIQKLTLGTGRWFLMYLCAKFSLSYSQPISLPISLHIYIFKNLIFLWFSAFFNCNLWDYKTQNLTYFLL